MLCSKALTPANHYDSLTFCHRGTTRLSYTTNQTETSKSSADRWTTKRSLTHSKQTSHWPPPPPPRQSRVPGFSPEEGEALGWAEAFLRNDSEITRRNQRAPVQPVCPATPRAPGLFPPCSMGVGPFPLGPQAPPGGSSRP